MVGHISCQNEPNHPLPEHLKLIFGKAFCEVALVMLQYGKGLRSMKMLLNRLVIGLDSSLSEGINVVPIGEPVMTQIVTDCRCNEG